MSLLEDGEQLGSEAEVLWNTWSGAVRGGEKAPAKIREASVLMPDSLC